MKEKTTTRTLMDSNFLFYFFPVPGRKLQSFFSSCAQCVSVSEASFFLLIMVLPLFGGGRHIKRNTVGKESLPLSVPNSFLSLPILKKNFIESTALHSVGKKEKL